MGHFRTECVCGRVLAQCRCPGPKTVNRVSPCTCAPPVHDAERIAEALYRKVVGVPGRNGGLAVDLGWVHDAVATVVADTLLIVEGTLAVEDFE